MHWLLFIHKVLFSCTCFEPQVLILRRIQLYTCSIWYCHSLWEFLVACRYTVWVRTDCRGKVLRHPPTTFPLQSVLTQTVYRQATRNSHREWQCHMLHVYNCILLKMSTWGSKHVEENSILWINNNQVGNLYMYSQFMMHGQKNISLQKRVMLWSSLLQNYVHSTSNILSVGL